MDNEAPKKKGRPRGKDSIAFLRANPEALRWSVAAIAERLDMSPRMVGYQLSIAQKSGVLKRSSLLEFLDDRK